MRAIAGVLAAGVLSMVFTGSAAAAKAYRNFAAAIYVPVGAVLALKDPKVREAQYQRISSQLKFDKVYVEVYRSGVFADDATLEAVKKFFITKGIGVAGGIAYSAPETGGQFNTLDYEDTRDRQMCRRASELAAAHFDEVILDDFFFYSTKSEADIAARGDRSWTQYRLERMRQVSDELVLKPARAINPHVKVTIKYPNWYEHFQALGYDLDQEAKQFDAIYTGTETRDPEITDQLLQQYESYLVFRFFSNVRPNGANRGGWVDTYATRYVDRYAEQLWDTLFAKAPEITLFNWADLASPAAVAPGDRQAWSEQATSFDWNSMTRSMPAGARAGWARVAGYSLEQVDKFLGQLGQPLGVASYKPYQSSGEDFLHDYLGNLGVPVELTPDFPSNAPLVLLTEAARQDPAIVTRIKQHLAAGKSVVITSGLLRALRGKGIEDIAEVEATERRIAVHDYIGAYGSGRGTSLNEAGKTAHDVLFPEIRFNTNDSWPLIRGVAEARGVPILVMNRYARGALYVLNIPDNPGDLYELPQPVATAIRTYLQGELPVRIDAPARVSLFEYDNSTFIVESFRSEPATIGIATAGDHKILRDLVSGEELPSVPQPPPQDSRRRSGPPEQGSYTQFRAEIPPHSFRVFTVR